ncbi:MAG: LysE family transporter [Bacteroidota bacterium]
MSLIFQFLVGFIVSFAGSVWLGTINMTVTIAAIKRSFKTAIWVGIGASSVEFFQAFLSLYFIKQLSGNSSISFYLQWLSIPVLLGLFLYFFFKKNAEKNEIEYKEVDSNGFLVGALISVLNILAILFWSVVGSYLQSANYIQLQPLDIAITALGIAFGTFAVCVLYAIFGQYIKAKYDHLTQYAYKTMSFLFLIMLMAQLMKNLDIL